MTSSYPSSRPDSQVESYGRVPNTPSQDAWLSQPPRASYLEQTPESFSASSAHGSFALHTGGNSSPLLAQHEKRLSEPFVTSSEHPHPEHLRPELSRKRSIVTRPIFWIIALAIFIIVAAAVILPVYFLVIKHHSNQSESSTPAGSTPGSSGPSPGSAGNSLTTGGNGSVVTTSDGTTFTYINNFGGFCKFAYFFRVFIHPSGVSCSESDYFVEHLFSLLQRCVRLPRHISTLVSPTPIQ